MDVITPERPTAPPRTAGARVVPLTAAAAVGVAVTAGLAARLGALLPLWLGPTAPGLDGVLRTARVEDLVEMAAVLIGTPLAVWFTVSLLAATVCAGARVAGRQWAAGERFVARTAPVVVRRALLLTAGTGVALAGAGLPAGAATTPPPTDLGWSPTVSSAPWQAPTPATPPAPAPDDVTPGSPGSPGSPEAGTAPDGDAPDAAVPAPPPTAPATPAPGATPPADAAASDEPPRRTAPAAPPDAARPTPGPPQPDAAPGSGPSQDVGAPTDGGSATGPARAPSAAPRTEGTAAASADPGRPTPTTGARAGAASPAATVRHPAPVTVLPGDTLWDIAAEHLPVGASVADVAAAWPAWYAANVDLIGADPDLIVPGQVLEPPPDVAVSDAASARPADGARS